MTAPTGSRRRLLAGILGLSLLAGAGSVATVQPVDARFTDTEHAASGTFTSFTVPPATITACTVTNNGLGLFQSVTLVWTSVYPASGVRLTLTQGATTAVVPASNISTTGPSGGLYTHTAVLSQTLLSGLITNLLGSTTTLTVNNLLVGTAWTSVGVSRQLSMTLAGLGATCV
ncbi:hypothetical protein [Microbacterium sp. 1.5R]|uniref:hypothetical protein n=1 Tax=Microbacterium sp. 1.5R TaxID=1916917 RepID=UPI0011A4E532|nr:hypothetical protein [Microbacterium sp. 1.5R]